MRKCGVLMPVSSLPSRFGIGGFSKEAYDFVDFLERVDSLCGRFCRLDLQDMEIPLISLSLLLQVILIISVWMRLLSRG